MILFGGFYLSHGETLKCQFKEDYFLHVRTVYYCDVTSLDSSLNNMTINGFTGKHLANKNNHNVKGIWIHDTNTKYIPANLGFLFNLTAFLVQNSNLIEIKAQNFIGMLNLEYLNLDGNKFKSIPSDTFSTLPKLKYIGLMYNQMEMIPSNLFSNNLNLEEIHLDYNKFKYIGSGVIH